MRASRYCSTISRGVKVLAPGDTPHVSGAVSTPTRSITSRPARHGAPLTNSVSPGLRKLIPREIVRKGRVCVPGLRSLLVVAT